MTKDNRSDVSKETNWGDVTDLRLSDDDDVQGHFLIRTWRDVLGVSTDGLIEGTVGNELFLVVISQLLPKVKVKLFISKARRKLVAIKVVPSLIVEEPKKVGKRVDRNQASWRG